MLEHAYDWLAEENLLIFGGLVFALLSAVCEAGFRFGCRRAKRHLGGEQERNAAVGTITASMLGLLSFTLGLTIGYAQDRAAARRGLVVHEANTIATAWLRAKLVLGDEGPAIAELIEELAKVELAFTVGGSAEPEARLVPQREALQDQIWGLVQTVARRDPTPVTSALITALNEMFDSALEQRFALQSRVPATVSWMLFWGSMLAIGAMGYQFGLAGARYPVLVLLLLGMWTGGMVLIVDLSRPRNGAIRVDPAPLIWTIQGFAAPPAPH
jgi:hypothetical protein